MQRTFTITTKEREALYDITEQVEGIVRESGVKQGTCHVYVKHATAAIMIQENWDDSVQRDVITLLRKIIPRGAWEHDRQDGNGDAHLKAGIVGPSETIPVKDGKLDKGRWQDLFLCEFDGPRDKREVIVTVTRA
ncbi:YjbQ family protein [Candidatus Woesearchaeota archaeon]|nr:YjbQ family protein [Candidatus Woesearchaeota archaeon]